MTTKLTGINPYGTHPVDRTPPEGFLAALPGKGQRECIAGTEEQMQSGILKETLMVVMDSPELLRRVLRWRGTVFEGVVWVCLVQIIWSSIIVIAVKVLDVSVDYSLKAHSFCIIPIGFMLVFRANHAYDRWWQGRLLISVLMNSTRSIAVKLCNFVDGEHDEKLEYTAKVLRLCQAFIIAVRQSAQGPSMDIPNLSKREKYALNELQKWELEHYLTKEFVAEMDKTGGARPLKIVGKIMEVLAEPTREDSPISYLYVMGASELQNHASDLLQAWQGMTAIVQTPVPFPHVHCLMWFLYIWVFTVPIPLVSKDIDLGWITIMVSFCLAVLLLGIDQVGEQLEDPFGNDPNDFDLVKYQQQLHVEMASLCIVEYEADVDIIWAPIPEEFRTRQASANNIFDAPDVGM